MGFAGPIGIGASALGAGVSAIGSLESGAAQQTAYNYQAQIAQMNAKIAQQEATQAIMQGGVEAEKVGMQVAQARGMQRAGFGAGNIVGATPSRVMASTTQVGQWNQQITANNALQKAYRLNVQGAEDVAQGNLATFEGQQAQEAGTVGAIGSILGGAGNVAAKFGQLGQSFGGSSVFNAPA